MAEAIRYQVVVLGESGVGKSALTVKFSIGHFDNYYIPTLADSHHKMIGVDGQQYALDIDDTAGDSLYRDPRDRSIAAADAIILVYSILSQDSFTAITELHKQTQTILSKKSDTIAQLIHSDSPKLPTVAKWSSVPMMLVGNQCDQGTKRKVTTEAGIKLAAELGCNFSEVSARTGEKVQESFYDLVRQLRDVHNLLGDSTQG